ncbi:uncharacterized protein DS421_5g150030 [Arachis hypogaea]|nr:uncharacterized protein DS421_5g150030 [Arachis hypogaea]
MVIIELQLKHEYPSICYNLVVILCNSDLKLLACLTMLANRADEIIVTTMVQRQSGVLHEVLSQSLFHRTMIVVLFFNLHHRVQSSRCRNQYIWVESNPNYLLQCVLSCVNSQKQCTQL